RPPRPTLFPYTTLFRSQCYRGITDEPVPVLPGGNDPVRCLQSVQPLVEPPERYDPAFQRIVGVDFFACSEHYLVIQLKDIDIKRSEEHTSELQSRENLV